MSEIQRIRKVLNWLIFSEFAENDTDLAKKLGYTKSSFSQIVNGKVPLSDKFINALCSCDENINKVWINTGNGNLLNNIEYPLQMVNEPQEKMQSESEEKNIIKLLKEKNSLLSENAELYKQRAEMYKEKYENCENEKKSKSDVK